MTERTFVEPPNECNELQVENNIILLRTNYN